jgi:SAM-dependent methyltransferase
MHPAELPAWFDHTRAVLESAYLSHAEPWRQSGQSGPYERWEALRKPVADCIDRPGAFLDIGCANGFLLECCLAWTATRGIAIEPFGLDISARLVDLARQRLPAYAANFYTGNCFNWVPPRRFDFVRTELVYVPAEYERAYIQRLLDEVVAQGGCLLIANYNEKMPDPTRGLLPGCHGAADILAHLGELGLSPARCRDGYDPLKDRHVRVAVLEN